MNKLYSNLYNISKEKIDKPLKENYPENTDGYISYLNDLKIFYNQLLPIIEFYVGAVDSSIEDSMLYLLLYDFKSDKYEVHWWYINEPNQNTISDLHCNHINIPKRLGYGNKEDVLFWLIGFFNKQKYIHGYEDEQILKIIDCHSGLVFYDINEL